MKNDAPETTRPLNMILDVREQVVTSKTQFLAHQHGILPRRDADTLQRKWHVQVLSYRQELARYRNRKQIREMWTEDIGDLDISLAEIKDAEFSTQDRVVEQFDPDTQQRRKVTQSEMFVFSPEQLVEITAKLDDCASALGFDVSVESEPEVFGVDPDWEPEEATNGRTTD
jgi:hypothetical protein